MKLHANISESSGHAAIAQLDRVTDYESVGRGFESLSPYQEARYPFGYLVFCCFRARDSNHLNARVRWTLAGWAGARPHLTICQRQIGSEYLSPYRQRSCQKVLEFPKGICYNTSTCRVSISAIIVASQASEAGSTPVPCSKKKDHLPGGLFLFRREPDGEVEPISMQQPCGLLRPPVQKLVAIKVYSTPIPCSRKERLPTGWPFSL